MSSAQRPGASRGFTLIELMVSVAIVGILSSVALPEYSRMTVRAKGVERSTVMEAIARAVSDTLGQQQRIPGGAWVGDPNPATVPGTTKRHFDWTTHGWQQLPMVIEGDTYYSYDFQALDDGSNVSLVVNSAGDVDGDGNPSLRTDAYVGVGFSLQPDPVAAHWVKEDPNVF